jgi:hypothetical protein
MAVLRNGPNGGFSGKAGSMIGYRLNGQDIIKGLPKKRKRRKISKLEQANRDKFALTQKWLKPLIDILRIGFKDYAPTFQGFVAAKSYNSKNALKQLEDGSHYIDPALALVSFGTLTLPETISMECINNEIIFNWSTDGHFGAIDQAMVLAYMPETGIAICDTAAAKRFKGTASLRIPKNPKGHDIHIYISFVSYDYTQRSNSKYLGNLKSS